MIIVSGHPRTGTSAMMRAIAHSTKRCTLAAAPIAGNVQHNDYIPNPYGLYEAGGNTRVASSLREIEDASGKVAEGFLLIKIFWDDLPMIPKGSHKVVFMTRDPDEIRASLRRVRRHFKMIGMRQNTEYPDHVRTFDQHRGYNEDDIEHVLGIMDTRSDVELIKVDFGDLIADSKREFERVSELVPIDIDKAASLIEPQFYRCRNGQNGENVADRLSANAVGTASQEKGQAEKAGAEAWQ